MPMLERVKTFLALDRVAAVIGYKLLFNIRNHNSGQQARRSASFDRISTLDQQCCSLNAAS
jgi:hypothetical protein